MRIGVDHLPGIGQMHHARMISSTRLRRSLRVEVGVTVIQHFARSGRQTRSTGLSAVIGSWNTIAMRGATGRAQIGVRFGGELLAPPA